LIVTGAEGFVGGHLLPHLLACGHTVFGTFLETHPDVPEATWIHADLTSRASVADLLARTAPEGIIHLAAISHVPAVAADPGRGFAANVTALVHLLSEGAGMTGPVVAVSSGEVYGRVPVGRLPIKETEPVAPLNLYGVTKACSEQVAWFFQRTSGIRCTVVRPFSQLGPGQSDTFVCSSFARQIARIMLGKASPSVRVGNLGVRRDFMDVRDVVRAYARLAERYEGPGPFNLCGGKSVAVGDVLRDLIAMSAMNIHIEVDLSRVRPSDIEDMVGDPSAFRTVAGWEPVFTLTRSLEDLLQYWLAQEARSDSGS
jgi:GDP-4-dehydro-6-deoxy-D-mannose reductase